jgi:hypothetical protein
MKVMTRTLIRNRKRITSRRRTISIVNKKVRTKKSQISRENSSVWGGSFELSCKSLQANIEGHSTAGQEQGRNSHSPSQRIVWGLNSSPIYHIPSSNIYLEVGYMLMKQFINHKEVLLVKTQHHLHHMQGVLVQGTEDEDNISLNKSNFVTHITKNVIDKVALKYLVV